MNDKVSVIVGVYNGQRFIEECIDSILNQTYQNIELILVDAGSTDDSYNILEEYKKRDNRVKVIHQKNGGVSAARNSGLKAVTGEYVTIVDQDDYLSTDFIQYMLCLLNEYDADIALTPEADKFSNARGHRVDKVISDVVEVWSGEQAAIQMLLYKLIIAPWNKLIKWTIISDNHISFEPNLFGGEGFCFSMLCFKHTKRVAVGQKKKYHYRLDNPDSGMTKFTPHIVESSLKAQKIIKNYYKNSSERFLMQSLKYANWHTACDCYNFIVGCEAQTAYHAMYLELRNIVKHDAKIARNLPIPRKDKLKSIGYSIAPLFTAKFINKFRVRQFTKIQ